MSPGHVLLLVAILQPASVLARGKPSCALIASPAATQTLAGTPVLDAVARGIVQRKVCRLKDPARLAPELATARAMGLDCGLDDTECLRKLAALLRVRRVIALDAAPAETGFALRMVHVDGPSGQLLATREDTLAPGDEAAQAATLVTALLEPPPAVGSLRVVVDRPGAQILVNSAVAGQSPLPQPLTALAPGSYTVEVLADGFARAQQTVDVIAGQEASVEFVLQPAPAASSTRAPAVATRRPVDHQVERRLSPSTLAWIVAGTGGALAVASGAGALALDGTLLLSAAGNADERAGMLLGERVLAGVAVVAALAGGVGLGLAFVFDDPAPATAEGSHAQAR